MDDPQYNVRVVMRPYTGFAEVYQGQSVGFSINLTPDGKPLDEKAGQPGYDSRLPRGLVVPKGARITLWLPLLYETVNDTSYPYIYRLTWRLRSLVDYLTDRKPYHVPNQRFGQPNVFDTAATTRYAIPAANQAVVYNQTEPASNLVGVVQHLLDEEFTVQGSNLHPVFLNPDGRISGPEQGIELATAFSPPTEMRASYVTYDCFALGDELLLSVRRANNAGADDREWDFTIADEAFSRVYSHLYPDRGAYVMIGRAAS